MSYIKNLFIIESAHVIDKTVAVLQQIRRNYPSPHYQLPQRPSHYQLPQRSPYAQQEENRSIKNMFDKLGVGMEKSIHLPARRPPASKAPDQNSHRFELKGIQINEINSREDINRYLINKIVNIAQKYFDLKQYTDTILSQNMDTQEIVNKFSKHILLKELMQKIIQKDKLEPIIKKIKERNKEIEKEADKEIISSQEGKTHSSSVNAQPSSSKKIDINSQAQIILVNLINEVIQNAILYKNINLNNFIDDALKHHKDPQDIIIKFDTHPFLKNLMYEISEKNNLKETIRQIRSQKEI
jgi:hypothetical protein